MTTDPAIETAAPSAQNPVRAWLAVARFAAGQTVWNRRVLLTLLLFLVPVLTVVVVRAFGHDLERQQVATLYGWVTVIVALAVIVPLTAMLYFSSLVSQEALEGTLVYLFTRRLNRPGVMAAKFVGAAVPLALMALLAQGLLFLAAAAGEGGMRTASGVPELWACAAVVALAMVVFGALFAALGVLVRRPLAAGIGYVFVCEWMLANRQLKIRQLSVNYYLRCILRAATERSPMAELFEDILRGETTPARSSLATLAMVAAAALLVACLAVWRKEFTQAREEQT